MSLILNDAKTMSKDDITTITQELYKNAKEEWKIVHFGTAYKIYAEWIEKMEIDVKKHVEGIKLSNLNLNCSKEKVRAIKMRKDTECKFSRRKVTYDAFEGKMYGLCTMQDILELINGKALDIFENLTKVNYEAVNNMIREKKGRKSSIETDGRIIGVNMKLNDKKQLIMCKASERIESVGAFKDYAWIK